MSIMDTSRSSLLQENVVELFDMLESPDEQTVESVKSLIHENLSASKDSWLLNVLVDYYIASQSTAVLNILVRVREPHDKHLFDKILEYMKWDKTSYFSLLLLSHLIHQQPSWLYKIAQHRTFQTLLNVLKADIESPCLMCGLFSLVSLLPLIPSKVGPYLSDIFEIFSRFASWSAKKPIGVPEIYILHLQVGVYALFHRLYGMYPCNFLGYLRSSYGGREYNEENLKVFTIAIKPMLERVRLHPLLVTACKETELSQKRWKRLASHDIAAECANLSLDSIEGTPENFGLKCSTLFPPFATSPENSMQFPSLNSLSSTVSLTVESTSVSHDATTTKSDFIWTPSETCEFSTPPPQSPVHYESEESTREFQPSEKNGNLKSTECESFVPIAPAQCGQGDLAIKTEASDAQNVPSVSEALEAKEEELMDKEVSELTSVCSSCVLKDLPVRNDTPFCSTTHNLTDKPQSPSPNSADNISKEKEEDTYEESDLIVQEHSELKMETFVRTMNRLRYFSQCGPAPEVPHDSVNKTVIQRSSSCPDLLFPEDSSVTEVCPSCIVEQDEKSVASSAVETPATVTVVSEKSSVQSSTWSDSTTEQTLPLADTSYDHLLPLSLQPLPVPGKNLVIEKPVHSMSSKSVECTPFYSSLSPAELLDRHLLMGTESNLSQLSSIPLTSSRNADWTHFGGKPPADEVALLQTQILLLHNQMMFERHRREIHSERNRRLLGKAKRTQMQEEYTTALKDHVLLLEKENDDLRMQLKAEYESRQNLELIWKRAESKFNISIKKLIQENDSICYSNKKLQGLLVSQKQENDKIREEHKQSQSELLDKKFEVELLQLEVARFQKREKVISLLSKEIMMLQEINGRYEEKLEFLKQHAHQVPDFDMDLIKDTAFAEIKSLKQMVESKAVLLDIANAKVGELYIENSNLKEQLSEQIQFSKTLSSMHSDEIKAREERLLELQSINRHYTAQILELYHKQELFDEQMKEGEQAVSGCDTSSAAYKTHAVGKNFDSLPVPMSSADEADFSMEIPSRGSTHDSQSSVIV